MLGVGGVDDVSVVPGDEDDFEHELFGDHRSETDFEFADPNSSLSDPQESKHRYGHGVYTPQSDVEVLSQQNRSFDRSVCSDASVAHVNSLGLSEEEKAWASLALSVETNPTKPLISVPETTKVTDNVSTHGRFPVHQGLVLRISGKAWHKGLEVRISAMD